MKRHRLRLIKYLPAWLGLAAVLLFSALILDGLVFGEPSVLSARFLLLY